RVLARRDAELAVAVERERAQVARRQAVRADELLADVAQLVRRVRELHVEQLGRVRETLEVVVKPEDRRPLRRVVAADPLEDAGSIVESVRADVDLRVVPVDQLAVHPDLLGGLHGEALLSRRAGETESYPPVYSAT